MISGGTQEREEVRQGSKGSQRRVCWWAGYLCEQLGPNLTGAHLRDHEMYLTVVPLRSHEVGRFTPPSPLILRGLRVTPRTWTLWFFWPMVPSRLITTWRNYSQAIKSQDTIILYGNCAQMASWVGKEDMSRVLMLSAMPFDPGNHMQKFVLPLCFSQWVDEC